VLAAIAAEHPDVRAALKGVRRGSRFAGPNSPDEVLDQLARGGSIVVPEEDGRSSGAARGDGRDRRGAGLGAAFTKAMALGTGSAGGVLVDEETHAEVVAMIRARSAVMKLGPRVVPVVKELDITSIASGATAYYVSENAPIPVSEMTLAEAVLLRPKELDALVPVSNRLLSAATGARGSRDLEQVLRQDLAEIIALREDLAFLQGTGGVEPLGIRNAAGLTPGPATGANGSAITFDLLKYTVAAIRGSTRPSCSPAGSSRRSS
jgi:HK97 family phage major capsid protein